MTYSLLCMRAQARSRKRAYFSALVRSVEQKAHRASLDMGLHCIDTAGFSVGDEMRNLWNLYIRCRLVQCTLVSVGRFSNGK